MTTHHKIVDDALPKEYFDKLVESIVWNETFNWTVNANVSDPKGVSDLRNWYFCSLGYWENVPVQQVLFRMVHPMLYKLPDFNSLVRVKANFFPYTSEQLVHSMHIDYPYKHKGALISLNTCDGYTLLEDGTKVDSIANRILYFDPSIPHASTTTTNAKGRFNININYL